jgi:predicted acylesterase/phospholipase RssA
MPDDIENVLILQGGGSLGAFGCGVYKALAKSNIKIDIVAGTSIGGLNASIIAGSKEDDSENSISASRDSIRSHKTHDVIYRIVCDRYTCIILFIY